MPAASLAALSSGASQTQHEETGTAAKRPRWQAKQANKGCHAQQASFVTSKEQSGTGLRLRRHSNPPMCIQEARGALRLSEPSHRPTSLSKASCEVPPSALSLAAASLKAWVAPSMFWKA